jgi:hypothetical protein
MNDQRTPYDFGEAVEAAKRAAELQRDAEHDLTRSVREHAQAEKLYRVALARRIVELRADGQAATLAADLARGDETVAMLRYERDIAEGAKDVAVQQAWRRSADRKDVRVFIEWSARVSLADTPDLHWTKEMAA